MDFMGSCAFLVELIGMPFWKRNEFSLFDSPVVWASCAVLQLWKGKAHSTGSQSTEMRPRHKEMLPVCSGFSCAHLEASARVRSPPCLKYASDSCSWGLQLAWQEKQLPCSSLQDFTEQCVCASNEIRLRLKPSIFMEYLLFVPVSSSFAYVTLFNLFFLANFFFFN